MGEAQCLEGDALVEFSVPGEAHHLAVLAAPGQFPGQADGLGDADAEAVAHRVAETEVAVDDSAEAALVERGQRVNGQLPRT